MKKIFNMLLVAVAVFFTACSNEAIEIETSAGKVKNAVTVTVSPTNFIAPYNFKDTKHDVDVAEIYRTFYSEQGGQIMARTYFYNKETGELVDTVKSYVNSADNDIVQNANLPKGSYYAISILCISYNQMPFWDIADRLTLETAKLVQKMAHSQWNLLSVSTEEFTVERGQHANITTIPSPVGSLIYRFYENFQYKNQSSYPTVQDNGIRSIGIFTRNRAVAYKLNPNAANKYEYLADAGTNSWWIVSDVEPTDFIKSWTFFETNIYGFDYFLAPQAHMTFGYTLNGNDGFNGYGEADYTFQPGKVYLAYWDYFKVGNPYLGIADNNHWNSYTTNARSYASMKALPGNMWSK